MVGIRALTCEHTCCHIIVVPPGLSFSTQHTTLMNSVHTAKFLSIQKLVVHIIIFSAKIHGLCYFLRPCNLSTIFCALIYLNWQFLSCPRPWLWCQIKEVYCMTSWSNITTKLSPVTGVAYRWYHADGWINFSQSATLQISWPIWWVWFPFLGHIFLSISMFVYIILHPVQVSYLFLCCSDIMLQTLWKWIRWREFKVK